MLQYNLRSLLLAMLAACVLTWFFVVLPGWVAIVALMCLFAVIPSTVLAGVLYCRGNVQAFFIGCIPPLVIGAVVVWFDWSYRGLFFGPSDAITVKIALVVCLIVTAAAGGAAAGIRYWATRPIPAPAPQSQHRLQPFGDQSVEPTAIQANEPVSRAS